MGVRRTQATEDLDDLTAAGPEHRRVLDELGWLNRWLGTTRRTVDAVLSVAAPDAHIVDLGCGGGHLLAALREARPEATLTAVDGNPAALQMCRERVPDVRTVCDDITAASFTAPAADVLVSTHFLYHFDDEALCAFFSRHPDPAVVMVELRRRALSRQLFRLLTPLVSAWTLRDGLVAIDRAFTPDELQAVLPGFELRVGAFEMVAVRSTSRGRTD